jgi:signal transduction histidine kinase
MPSTDRRRWTAQRSLQRELPIGIGLLLAIAVVALAGFATREVRRAAIAAASDRLDRATLQLAQILTQSARTRFAVMESTATLPAVRAFARAPRGPAPLDALRRLASAPLIVSVELWDPAGRRLAHTATIPPLDSAHTDAVIGALREGRTGIGRFDMLGDTVVYALVTTVGDAGSPLGYLVERRRLATTSSGNRALADLIGERATLAIGNATGDLWTDFNRRVPGPPIDVLAPGTHAYPGDSVPVFGRSARVAATPWQVAVEFPRELVLAPAQRFLTRVGVLAAGILATGIGAAWLVSRWITRPLRQLTEAAEAIAAGRSVVPPSGARRDEIGRLTSAFHDMAGQVATARAHLEAQVAERTAALQDSLHELEGFSYTVSHDLRAPLRGMQGFAQALLEDYGPKLDATGEDYARRVVEASRRMDVLIQDLLSYSRLSREQLSIGVVDLDPIVAEVAGGLAAGAGHRGARIEIASPLGAVRGNARILQQVLQNLIDNAVKFVPPDVTPHVRVSTEVRDGRCRVWVDDNGIGIAPEHQQRIFRVFERLHGGETYPGTGIGLAIVRRGAERMGGDAGVASTPGQGSRFWIELAAAST